MSPDPQEVINVAVASAKEGSRAQVRREVARALTWFSEHDITSAEAIEDAKDLYVADLEACGIIRTPDGRKHWRWVVGRLSAAVRVIETRPRIAKSPRNRTSAIDALLPGSDVEQTIATIIGRATSESRARVIRCDLALFLAFLSERDRDVRKVDLFDLERFRDWLGEPGPKGKPRRSQPKSALVPARALMRELATPFNWLGS